MEKSVTELSEEYGSVLLDRDLRRRVQSFPTLYHDKEETVKESIQLFNEERYWECHEALEQILATGNKSDRESIAAGCNSLRISSGPRTEGRRRYLHRDDSERPYEVEPVDEGSYYSLNVDILEKKHGRDSKKWQDYLSEGTVMFCFVV